MSSKTRRNVIVIAVVLIALETMLVLFAHWDTATPIGLVLTISQYIMLISLVGYLVGIIRTPTTDQVKEKP